VEPIVSVKQGRLRGRVVDGVTAFLGIPYAAAPVGPALYQAPGPAPAWDGVRDCDAFGPTAPKPPYAPPFDELLADPDIPGDDFLNLNVWTPDPGTAGLPVFVWIHGGAFRNGSGAVPTYDGAAFARDGVVCVTLNYRLGVPGFAHVPDAPDNRGLRDQLAALAWVRDNIAAFGGDPGRVTVAGESAGAMSVVTLLASPHGAGLFQRAVAQSGAGQGFVTAADAGLVAAKTAALAGVEPTAAGFAEAGTDPLVEAQAAVARELTIRPDRAVFGASVVAAAMAYPPVLDGDILPRPPLESVAAGAGRDIPLLTGTNAEEFRLWLAPSGVTTALTDDALRASVPDAVADAYAAARPGATPGDLLAAVVTDRYFRAPAIRLAEARAGALTHMYEFAWRSPVARLGAAHAVELGFVFDTLACPATRRVTSADAPEALASRMHAAWVSFASTGDPGWPPYEPSHRRVRLFTEPDGGVTDDPRGAERRLWER
jgi:para-nitrobenzyl esterase